MICKGQVPESSIITAGVEIAGEQDPARRIADGLEEGDRLLKQRFGALLCTLRGPMGADAKLLASVFRP